MAGAAQSFPVGTGGWLAGHPAPRVGGTTSLGGTFDTGCRQAAAPPLHSRQVRGSPKTPHTTSCCAQSDRLAWCWRPPGSAKVWACKGCAYTPTKAQAKHPTPIKLAACDGETTAAAAAAAGLTRTRIQLLVTSC